MKTIHQYSFCTLSRPATKVKSELVCGSGERAKKKKHPVQTDTHNSRKQVPKQGGGEKNNKKNNNLKACTISTEDNTDEKEKGVNTTKRWKGGPQTADESKMNMYTLHTIGMLLLHQIVTDTFLYSSPVYCLLNKFTHKQYTNHNLVPTFFFLKHAFNAG